MTTTLKPCRHDLENLVSLLTDQEASFDCDCEAWCSMCTKCFIRSRGLEAAQAYLALEPVAKELVEACEVLRKVFAGVEKAVYDEMESKQGRISDHRIAHSTLAKFVMKTLHPVLSKAQALTGKDATP